MQCCLDNPLARSMQAQQLEGVHPETIILNCRSRLGCPHNFPSHSLLPPCPLCPSFAACWFVCCLRPCLWALRHSSPALHASLSSQPWLRGNLSRVLLALAGKVSRVALSCVRGAMRLGCFCSAQESRQLACSSSLLLEAFFGKAESGKKRNAKENV